VLGGGGLCMRGLVCVCVYERMFVSVCVCV